MFPAMSKTVFEFSENSKLKIDNCKCDSVNCANNRKEEIKKCESSYNV